MAIPNTSRTRNFGAGSPAGASVAAYGPYWNAELDLLYANDVELQNLIDSITVTADNSVQLTGAQTAAGAKTWSDAAVFSSTAQIDGAADLNSTLDVQGAANFQSTAAFTGEIQANGGMDVATGQSINHDGNPVAGYLDDGTAYYRKRLTGTFGGSSPSITIAHGLGPIFTNDKIVGANAYIKTSTTANWLNQSSSTGDVRYYYIDDTNFLLVRYSASPSDPFDVFGFIDYIL